MMRKTWNKDCGCIKKQLDTGTSISTVDVCARVFHVTYTALLWTHVVMWRDLHSLGFSLQDPVIIPGWRQPLSIPQAELMTVNFICAPRNPSIGWRWMWMGARGACVRRNWWRSRVTERSQDETQHFLCCSGGETEKREIKAKGEWKSKQKTLWILVSWSKRYITHNFDSNHFVLLYSIQSHFSRVKTKKY